MNGSDTLPWKYAANKKSSDLAVGKLLMLCVRLVATVSLPIPANKIRAFGIWMSSLGHVHKIVDPMCEMTGKLEKFDL